VTLLTNLYMTTNTPSRARYASVYGASHSRGGPNCSLVKEADIEGHQAVRLSLPTVLGGGGKDRHSIFIVKLRGQTT